MATQASQLPTTLPQSVCSAVGARADDLLAAAAAALAGGAATLGIHGAAELAIEDAGRGPVTAADRASHEAILAALAALRAGEPVRSEEGAAGTMAGSDGRLWIVDPLDGTREFIDGLDEFSVMVGLAQDGVAVLGAVYRPAVDRLFLGIPGAGAWLVESAAGRPGDRPGPWDRRMSPLGVGGAEPARLRMVESRSHRDDRLARLSARLADRFACVSVLSGSAGTKCALVASGEAHLYVHPVPHLKEWDTCAGEAVARGAGARVTDCAGAPLRYGKSDPVQATGIFVAPPVVWERVAPDVAVVAPDRA